MFSISFGFKNDNGFLAVVPPSTVIELPTVPPPYNGTPSTTYNGLLLLLTDEVPLIVTFTAPPGSPEFVVTFTPATRPCNNCSGEEIIPLLKDFSPKETTAPVASLILRVP